MFRANEGSSIFARGKHNVRGKMVQIKGKGRLEGSIIPRRSFLLVLYLIGFHTREESHIFCFYFLFILYFPFLPSCYWSLFCFVLCFVVCRLVYLAGKEGGIFGWKSFFFA